MTRVVYAPKYNLRAFGLGWLHPFDLRKYGRAWRIVKRELGADARRVLVSPRGPVERAELLRVHSAQYLDRLRDTRYVAAALEVPLVGYLPAALVDWCVLQPMRWAVAGSLLGMRMAIEHGLAINLGGGFHHAKPSAGEGFCVYSDIGLVVAAARDESLVGADATIACIDLDAHQGNGVAHVLRDDRRAFLFDIYNCEIYPRYDRAARDRVDCDVPVLSGTADGAYLSTLRRRLPGFLDSIGAGRPLRLAIYNAGTDIVAGDPLGQLGVSADGVLQRDLFVVEELRRRQIPTLMLASGGYTRQSHVLMARSVVELVRRYGA